MKLKQPTCARPPRVIFSLNQTPYAKPWSKNGGSHVFVFQISPLRTHVDLWLCQLCHHCAGLSLSSCVPLPNSKILAPPLSSLEQSRRLLGGDGENLLPTEQRNHRKAPPRSINPAFTSSRQGHASPAGGGARQAGHQVKPKNLES